MRAAHLFLSLSLALLLMLAACAAPRMTPPAHPESVLTPDEEINPSDPEEIDPEAPVPIIEAEVDDSEAVDGEEEEDDGRA